MSQSKDKDIILLESDGQRCFFSPVELQSTLLNCFLKAGLRENCYFAEDIALAVEYALVHGEHSRRLFSRLELDAVVVQILSDTGLADVAALYKSGSKSVMTIDCKTDCRTILTVLRKFMVGSEAHLDNLAQKVEVATSQLNITNASPGLLVELARHYEGDAPPVMTVSKVRLESYKDIKSEDILDSVSDGCRKLVESGIIKIHNISTMFPSVRLYCFINLYAKYQGVVPPLTELFFASEVYELSCYLEELRVAALNLYKSQTNESDVSLPCYLNLPDISDFVEYYFEIPHGKTQDLERDISIMIQDAIRVPLERVNIGI